MPGARESHLFTGNGALCGVPTARRWSLVESQTTCPECRALLESRREERRVAKGRTPVRLARLRRNP